VSVIDTSLSGLANYSLPALFYLLIYLLFLPTNSLTYAVQESVLPIRSPFYITLCGLHNPARGPLIHWTPGTDRSV